MTKADKVAIEQVVADVHRREWSAVLASTVRVARDLDLAEECVQDAYVTAIEAWARNGVPDNPAAWLTTTAKRKVLDVQRREQIFRAKLPLLVDQENLNAVGATETYAVDDDRLRLIFTCCHPALAPEAQVALTLRLICGISTADIAHTFLVSEPTMAARITRAKKKIAAARIAYRIPVASELPNRLDAVLTVIHLLFTTGHTAPFGAELVRSDLAVRAIELCRLLATLMPDELEVTGLLGLMLVTDARSTSRTDANGELVRLQDQDRSKWDQDAIEQGHLLVVRSLRGGFPGRFALQAAIAALHAKAESYERTDWPQILVLYDRLFQAWPSPVVSLNRAVARSMVDGPILALNDIADLEDDGRLTGYLYLPATKADLLWQLSDYCGAAEAYRAAIALTENLVERRYLSERLAECVKLSAQPTATNFDD